MALLHVMPSVREPYTICTLSGFAEDWLDGVGSDEFQVTAKETPCLDNRDSGNARDFEAICRDSRRHAARDIRLLSYISFPKQNVACGYGLSYNYGGHYDLIVFSETTRPLV